MIRETAETPRSHLYLVGSLDQQFASLHNKSRKLIETLPTEYLYRQPVNLHASGTIRSGGEYILRSAGLVEQTFGGLRANLWDDPFEWTQPETLSTAGSIIDYLEEVDATRRGGFALFTSDAELSKQIQAPGGFRTLSLLLLDCLVGASHYQGQAFAVSSLFSAVAFSAE